MSKFLAISRIITKTAVFLLAATPLILTPWMIYPFTTGKSLFVILVIALAFPFWVALLIFEPAARPKPRPLVLALGGYLAIQVVAGLVGIDPSQSFWGRDERMMGGIVLVALLVGFLMAIGTLRTERAWRALLLVVVGVALVNIFWGVTERLVPSFWVQFRGGSHRVTGLFGNAIFYANYLLGIFFVAAALAFQFRRWWLRAALAVVAVGAAIGIQFSGTRGAQLGFLVGVAILLVYLVLRVKRRTSRIVIVSLAAAGAAVILFFTLTLQPGAKGYNPALKPVLEPFIRLRSAFNPNDPSARGRLLIWEVALKGIEQRPLFGWGPENFDYLFDQNFDPRFLGFSVHESFADRPHNLFLEIAAASGGLGLVALAVFQAAFIIAVSRRRRNQPPAVTGALWGFLAATDVALFFSFDTAASLLTAVFLSAWIVRQTGGEHSNTGIYQYPVRRMGAVAAAGIVAMVVVVVAVIRPAQAFGRLGATANIDPSKSGDLWLRRLQEAESISQPYRDAVRYRISNAVFAAVGEGRVPEAAADRAVEFAITTLGAAADRHPLDYGYRFSYANLLLLSATRGRVERFPEAEAEFLRAAELSPRRQSTYFQLGNLKLAAGDAPGALPYLEKAVALDPTIAEPHWHLGLGLVKAGEPGRAETELLAALELGFKPKLRGELREAASFFYGLGRLAETVRVYELAVDALPNDAGLHAELATAYAESGNISRAREEVERAVELDPSFAAEAELFLKLLEEGTLPSDSQR